MMILIKTVIGAAVLALVGLLWFFFGWAYATIVYNRSFHWAEMVGMGAVVSIFVLVVGCLCYLIGTVIVEE